MAAAENHDPSAFAQSWGAPDHNLAKLAHRAGFELEPIEYELLERLGSVNAGISMRACKRPTSRYGAAFGA